ncbi:MAG TPA: high frequency lysogenization protein HflD [Rudaea sp.]
MREERVVALAGVFQAAALAREVATRGSCDASAMQTSLESVLKIDAETPADVFGGISGVRRGFEEMIAQLDDTRRDLAMTRMIITALRLERALSKRSDMLDALRTNIAAIDQRFGGDPAQANLAGRLGQLYSQTLSNLRPRIVVEGNPAYLTQSAKVDLIRALLLAAIRAAVLWRQLGGSQLRLIFRRKQYAMLARGLLARCTLSGG